MTNRQKKRLRELLIQREATHFDHGDCVGSDEEAHQIARELGLYITAHPGDNITMRACCQADEVREPKPMLERNKDIVDETEELAAAPEGEEILRSGTWSTVRYSRKVKKKRYIIYP